MIMEAEKPQYLQLAKWKLRRANVLVSVQIQEENNVEGQGS